MNPNHGVKLKPGHTWARESDFWAASKSIWTAMKGVSAPLPCQLQHHLRPRSSESLDNIATSITNHLQNLYWKQCPTLSKPIATEYQSEEKVNVPPFQSWNHSSNPKRRQVNLTEEKVNVSRCLVVFVLVGIYFNFFHLLAWSLPLGWAT